MVRTRKFNLKLYRDYNDESLFEYCLRYLSNIRLQFYKQYLNLIDADLEA